MTDADRRRVDAALVRLGYCAARVVGIFGPDTGAATCCASMGCASG